MRVIAGNFKGIRLQAVPGTSTRPTSDKIKETMFNMIGPYFPGGHCLDLFAGSGSLAIEALSRGINSAILVDKNQQAIKCIEKNMTRVKAKEKTKLLRMNAFKALKLLSRKKEKFNLIILDPPYDEIQIEELLKSIIKADILVDDSVILVEHKGILNITDELSFEIVKEKQINKTTTITILRHLVADK